MAYGLKTRLVLLVVCCVSVVTWSTAAADENTDGGLVSEDLLLTELTGMTIGARRYRIWRNMRTMTTQRLEQELFQYEPLMLPKYPNPTGLDLGLKVVSLPNGEWEVRGLQIALDSLEATHAAVAALNSFFSGGVKQGQRVLHQNVRARVVSHLTLEKSERFAARFPTVAIANADRRTGPDRPQQPITFVCSSEASANELAGALPELSIRASARIAGSVARYNAFSVRGSAYLNSQLYAELDGKGKKYVRRSDARKIYRIRGQDLGVIGVIEAPERVEDSFFKTVTTKLFDETWIPWTSELLSSTFAAEDLQPDKVTREMMHQTAYYERNKSFDGSFKGTASAIISKIPISGTTDAAMKTAQKHLEKHGLKFEWNGEKWIPKQLYVLQRNTVQVAQDSVIGQAIAYAAPRSASWWVRDLSLSPKSTDGGLRDEAVVSELAKRLLRPVPVELPRRVARSAGTQTLLLETRVIESTRPDRPTPANGGFFVAARGTTSNDLSFNTVERNRASHGAVMWLLKKVQVLESKGWRVKDLEVLPDSWLMPFQPVPRRDTTLWHMYLYKRVVVVAEAPTARSEEWTPASED